MHKPIRADRPNAFSDNSSSVLSCIQTTVDIPSQKASLSTFELPYHALVGPGREGGVRVGESPTLLGSELLVFLYGLEQSSPYVLAFGVEGSGLCIFGLLYVGSLVVLLVYSILYGLTAKESNWLGATTSAAVIILVKKSIDSGRPSLALCSSSCRSVVQEPEVGSSFIGRNLEHNSSLVVCSSSCLKSQGSDSSTSTSANQQILDLNLALAFQEKLSDPRITSMLKRKGRHTERELANFLQDKGLDPNFTVMLKENGLDPMILALLQRSSLDADREYCNSNPPVTDSNDVEDVLPNHISFLEELRLQGLGKWLQRCTVVLHHIAGTLERAWLLFSLIFILETVVVAIFRTKTIKILNASMR
ncbi:hypothetical protein P3L10_029360 [Capsicum annuum]